jgi:anti-anti-sigma regulatory factor
MQSTIERDENGVRVTLAGPAHLGGLPDLEQAMRSVVASTNAGDVVIIDLDGLTAIHDAAIGMLGGTIVDITAKSGRVHVICQRHATSARVHAISEALA